MNRRDFLTQSAAVAAPMFLPARARGANDRLVFGAIGTGNRGGWLHETFQKLGAQCVAVCDVYQPHREKARAKSPAGAKTFTDHHELLAMPGLDFVVTATPDHHHKQMLLDALNAKLDVYQEKPLSLNLEESAVMVESAKKSDRIVQIGMQRRSMGFIRNARQLIQDGGIGRVTMVEAVWNWHFALPLDNSALPGELDWPRFLGSAPQRPLEPRRFRWWRGFWDYSGGNMTDQGTHLMDVVQWMTDSPPPLSAACQGMILNAEGVEVPNIFSTAFEYPDFLATWTLNYRSSFRHDWSIIFRGEKQTMVMNRLGYQLYKDAGDSGEPWSQKVSDKPDKTVPDTDGPEAHLKNFLDCVRSRQQTNCPPEVAANAVAGPHMANLAFKQGRKVKRDAAGSVA
jgi:predicted dehydrogenase